MLHSTALGNSYFPTRISESEVGVPGARRIPSFPLGNTTSDFKGTIRVSEPNGMQHKSPREG